MDHLKKFYINGAWVEPEGSGTIDVLNPATEEVIGALALGTEGDVNNAVAAAKDAFETYPQTTREERIALFEKILAAYQAHYAELAEAVSKEMGAPKMLAEVGQAGSGMGHFATMLEILKTYEFERETGTTQILKEPVGVCGFITPWNWPINQIACKVAPALAAGCTMILKPSEVAPLSGLICAEILHEAGVPKGVFNLVSGDGPTVGRAISAHPDIDMVSFTGSTRAGADVAAQAAAGIKRVTQELGGKSANILLDDVDFAKTVARDVLNIMGNSGQSCNAPTRMLVPAGRMDEVAAIAKEAADGIKVGDPTQEDTRMGPVVSETQWNKIQGLIQKGIDEGATLVTGGTGRPDGLNKGYYVRPTIFANVTNDMTIAREEIFGPVLSIIGYRDEEDAVRIANDTDYGLSGYVSSEDTEKAKSIARRLRTGNVHLNGTGPDFNAPFGGYKLSGNGREWGVHGLEEFLETKAVMGFNAAAE
ncbi:aldehyde dehydrogenase family protein [bacterium AH-315-P15]|nr:aldehyde dehydrogenase family protein [bacterium AH-315-P15]